MPIFDYRCNNCKEVFNKLYLTKEELDHEYDDLKCPNCENTEVTKIISVVGGFDLKGKGFYKNDYGNKK